MNFLGRKPSHTFVKFIRMQEQVLDVAVIFQPMSEHPVKDYKDHLLGTYGETSTDFVPI